MSGHSRNLHSSVGFLVVGLAFSAAAAADPAHSTPRLSGEDKRIAELQSVVEQQQSELDRQNRLIATQSALLEELQKKVADLAEAVNSGLAPVSDKPASGLNASGKQAGFRDPAAGGSQSASVEAAAAVAPGSSVDVATEPKSDPTTFRAYWRQGLRFDTPDKHVQLKFGGRIMNDWGFFSADEKIESSIGSVDDGTEFRRARLYMEGLLNKRVRFKAQYDFAGGDAGFKDVYIGLAQVPAVGNILFGHVKEPFSLETQTSSKYIIFMERALPFALVPERNAGAMFQNVVLGQKMTWAFGVFREVGLFGGSVGNGGYNYTGRVTARPWFEDNGGELLHLGFAYRHGNPVANRVRFRSRPEAHLTPRFVDTRWFDATSSDAVGTEFAIVLGPTSVQSEYILTSVDLPVGQRENFSSFYVQGSWFLTGEHRVYKSSIGAFDRVKPKHSLGDVAGGKGKGAWEIAARYSRLDLTDSVIVGGELQDFTFGLNWYLNPNTRFMWNYGLADRVDLGTANLFQTRFQVDF